MGQYRDESHAATRAVNAGQGRPNPAQWQGLYVAGYRESPAVDSDLLEGIDKMLGDSMTHALMHKALSDAQYQVVVLKHCGHDQDRIRAVKYLAGVVGTKAGHTCKLIAVGSWAIKGYNAPASANWDQQDVTDRTLRGWRKQIHDELKELYGLAMGNLRGIFADAGLINPGRNNA